MQCRLYRKQGRPAAGGHIRARQHARECAEARRACEKSGLRRSAGRQEGDEPKPGCAAWLGVISGGMRPSLLLGCDESGTVASGRSGKCQWVRVFLVCAQHKLAASRPDGSVCVGTRTLSSLVVLITTPAKPPANHWRSSPAVNSSSKPPVTLRLLTAFTEHGRLYCMNKDPDKLGARTWSSHTQ